MAHTTAEWVAAVAKMRKLVGVYLAVKPPLSAHQQASLATDLKTLDTDLAELGASLQATIVPTGDDGPLSSDPAEAENQLLRRLGFDPAVTNPPGALLGAASPEQNRELVLLGLFGTPDDQATFPTADFTLYSLFYERVGGGGWGPKEPYANTGTWQAYIASKGV